MDGEPIHVLLIEDNPADALLVREELEKSVRFGLSHARRLDAGLEVTRGGGIDAVLLDLSLPDACGLDTFRAVRQAAPHLPIVVLSGLMDEETAIAAVAEGAQDYLVKGPTVPAHLIRALHYAVHRKRQEEDLRRRNTQLAELAASDELTGLRNYRHLHEALAAASSMAVRTQRPLSVVMLDVDRFKLYNDDFGHPAGDEVLRRVGGILRGMTRAHDLAARYGGEEFAVLLPATATEAARAFAERVRIAIAGVPWPHRAITASLGVATGPTGACDGAALLARADEALYRAKRAGRNRVIHHDDQPDPPQLSDLAWSSPLVVQPDSDCVPAPAGDAMARHLAARIEEQTAELERIRDGQVDDWARAIDLHDHETGGQSRRVAELTVRLARRMGFDEAELIRIRRGALLHDLGKVAIPEGLLNKPGPLDEEEWRVMRTHPVMGYEMLRTIPFLQSAVEIPYCHHERWDGSGYPRGLKGEEIPATARLFAVVDVWDALTHDRPYRAAWSADRARTHIRSEAGSHLDPHAVEEFLAAC
jgi:diguanylate cyclase (GGDEF)-like protein/putative nucleotidyltransferase with HDIG domain